VNTFLGRNRIPQVVVVCRIAEWLAGLKEGTQELLLGPTHVNEAIVAGGKGN
jgi:hypothetical protein